MSRIDAIDRRRIDGCRVDRRRIVGCRVDRPARGRIGYAAVRATEVADLVAGGMLEGADVGDCLGVVDEDPWLAGQQRVSFARVGLAEPTDIDAYAERGGWAGTRFGSGLFGGWRTPARWRRVRRAGRAANRRQARFYRGLKHQESPFPRRQTL